MTFRTSLARYVKGLLEETPTISDPPTKSPTSIPPTTTPSTTTATSEAVLTVILETMERMQRENLREIRGMVTDILQGREIDQRTLERMQNQSVPPETLPFDPPDYDDPSNDPDWMTALSERDERERDEARSLRTEQEVLARQLDEARAALSDPQGVGSVPFSSKD